MPSRTRTIFFYEGGDRSRVLNQIHHCVRFSPGVIALTGPTGSGRSLILRVLVDSYKKDEIDSCFFSEESTVLETEEELFRALADGFGLEEKPIEIVEDLVDRVQHFIEVELRSKRIVLIVIDDIKQHSDEVLEALLQLVRNMKGLTLLLSGELSLVATLKQFNEQSILLHQIILRPLLVEETFDFLHQYLLRQGIEDDSLLDRKKLEELMYKTGGNLSLLVREVQQLVSGMQVQTNHFYMNLPIAHVAALMVVIIITVLAYVYYPASSEDIRDGALSEKTVATDSPIPDELTANRVAKQEDEIVAAQTLPVQSISSIGGSYPVVDELSHSSQNDTTSAVPVYTSREQELLNRPAGNITLQVLSLSSEKKVKAFMEHVTVADKSMLSYYRRGTVNKSSYVVLYGDYPDKQKAVQAQKLMPEELKKLVPWLRPMTDIQKELTQRQ